MALLCPVLGTPQTSEIGQPLCPTARADWRQKRNLEAENESPITNIMLNMMPICAGSARGRKGRMAAGGPNINRRSWQRGRLRYGQAYRPPQRISAQRTLRGWEEHTSELQSLMRISYAVSRLNKNHKQYICHNE